MAWVPDVVPDIVSDIAFMIAAEICRWYLIALPDSASGTRLGDILWNISVNVGLNDFEYQWLVQYGRYDIKLHGF